MKKILYAILAVVLTCSAVFAQTPSILSVANSGVPLFATQSAKVTATAAPVRLPNFSGAGTLTVTMTGITGSPSGCTIVLAYVGFNAASSATTTFATISFTPATGVQQFSVNPTIAEGDQITATYACSSTYPTAGYVTASFSPAAVIVVHQTGGDACMNPNLVKSSVVLSVASATTVQVVPLSTGKQIYVCGVVDGSAGTTPSLALLYGTGTNCGSGTTALTGAVPFTSGSALNLGWGGNIVAAPVSNALCVTTVGAGHYGVVTYVQQ